MVHHIKLVQFSNLSGISKPDVFNMSLTRHESRNWYFYASEVAGLIGRSKYKKKWEAFVDVFKRLDHGVHFNKARQLHQTSGDSGEPIVMVQTREEQAQQAVADFQVEHIQRMVKQHVSRTADELKDNVARVEARLAPKESQVKTQKEKTLLEYQKATYMAHDLEEDLRRTSERDTVDVEIQQRKARELESIQAQVSQLKEQVDTKNQEWHNFQTMKEYLTKQHVVQYGQHAEQRVIDDQLIGEVTNGNAQFYRKLVHYVHYTNRRPGDMVRWGVGGKVDGFRNGKLIEIKNRVNRLFDPLPEYELIQLQIYMFLLDLQDATLCQVLSSDGKKMKKETEVIRDPLYWQQVIVPELQEVANLLDFFIQNEEWQAKFFASDDKQKTRVLTAMSKKILSDSVNEPSRHVTEDSFDDSVYKECTDQPAKKPRYDHDNSTTPVFF